MKNYFLLIAAVFMFDVALAQHTQTESKKDVKNNKAMLDGQAFAVLFTESISGTTGTPGNVSEDKIMENQDMSKRDVEGGQPAKPNNNDLTDIRKMLIRFENGEVKISGKGKIKSETCPYNSWGMESTGISFSSECGGAINTKEKSDKNRSGTNITGTVNGDTVHGTITCTKDDGTLKAYSYTGSKAGPNDLDLEHEMGMK